MSRFTRLSIVVALASAVMLASASAAFAQQQQQESTEFPGSQLPGWTFTPGVIASAVYDDNVGLAAEFVTRPDTRGDGLFVVAPFGQVEYNGPRTAFESGYRGSLRRYVDLDELNGFDQRAYASLRHRATQHLTLFATETFTKVPSTDELEVEGVIFARTGSRANTLAAGIQSRLTKFMDFNLRYDFTWIEFDRTNLLLQSGFLNGVRADLARRLSERASFGAEYGIRFAELQEGTRNFAFQELGAIFRYDASPHTSIDAAGGISLLNDRTLNESRSGPYVRGGITYRMQRATVGANFARTFTPTFGFGGSASSQAFRAFVRMPLTRNRVYVQQSVSWRRTDPFVAEVLPLDSWWLHSTLGYSMSRWMRVEGFYSFARQDSRVPGGLINRQRIGAQIVVADPMRIR